MYILKGVLILFVMVFFPLMIGDVVVAWTKTDEHTKFDNIVFRYVIGNILMWAIYELIAVPLILLKQRFIITVYIWGVIIIALVICDVIYILKLKEEKKRKEDKERKLFRNSILDYVKYKENVFTILVAIVSIIVIGYQCYSYVAYTHIDEDDARFIAIACDAYDRDNMLLTNPSTGEYEGVWFGELVKDVTSPWTMYIACISKIISIYPTIVAHSILPVFLLCIAYGTYWILGKNLFRNNKQQNSWLFVLVVSLLNMFFGTSIYTESVMMLSRIWQGKAVVASVILGIDMYLIYRIVNHKSEVRECVLLLLANIAACLLSGQGIIMGCIITVIYGVCVLLYQKKWKNAFLVLCTCIPNGVFMMIYYVIKLTSRAY